MKEKFAYITDLHLDEQFPKDYGVDCRRNWQEILNDVSQRGISKIIYGGDIGEPSSNQWFFETLKGYDLDITLGNHDQFSEVTKYFPTKVELNKYELYYSKETELFKSIFLDTSSEEIGQEQMEWLKTELLTRKKVLLFVHHPILPIDTEADRQFALKGREGLQDLILNSRLQITIFCGHYHMSDSTEIGNVQQYITPASSVQVIKNPQEILLSGETFGYRILELNNHKIKTELIMFS